MCVWDTVLTFLLPYISFFPPFYLTRVTNQKKPQQHNPSSSTHQQRAAAEGPWRLPLGPQHQRGGGRPQHQLPAGAPQPQHLPRGPGAAGGARPAGLALPPRPARLPLPLPRQQPAEAARRLGHLQQVHLQVCAQVSFEWRWEGFQLGCGSVGTSGVGGDGRSVGVCAFVCGDWWVGVLGLVALPLTLRLDGREWVWVKEGRCAVRRMCAGLSVKERSGQIVLRKISPAIETPCL